MGRRTHPPRAAASVAAAIVFAAALGPGTASAVVSPKVADVTTNVAPVSPNGSNGWYNSGTIDVTFTVVIPMGETETEPRSPDCGGTSITTDTAGTTVSCTVTTDAGPTTATTPSIKRDTTDPNLAPQITPATLVVNGPGTATPNATDATSGVATQSCGAVDTSTAGAHSLTCTATDNAGNQRPPQMVNYTVQPHGPAASVAGTKGDGQVAYVTRQFASSLVVTVTDAQGNPVPGETVTFRAPLSGPSADLSRLTDVTNGNGVTSIRAFANNKVGSYVITGKIKGIGTARFDLRNAAAPYFADGFSRGLRKWKRTGDISIARGAGRPAPSMLLRANAGKTFATHGLGRAYATACASASVRLNSLGGEALALLRFRGAGDSGISRVSVESDRELFVRNDRRGGVKLSGTRLPLGEWHEVELCTHVGAKGTISLYLDGTKILGWRQGLGDRGIAAIHLIENDKKTFSLNVDDVLVDRRPGAPV
ncbi:MAG: Ig-like domain-containing protein [Actinomycetota bacterium]